MDAVVAVATAAGFPPRDAFMARATGMMTARGSGFASSMYRDMQANAPVEVEHILADLLDRATASGVPAPLLEAAVVQLRIYQNRVLASPAAGSCTRDLVASVSAAPFG